MIYPAETGPTHRNWLGGFPHLCLAFLLQLIALDTFLGSPCTGQDRRSSAEAIEIQFGLLELPSAEIARQKWNQPATFAWDKQPLRQALASIEKNYKLATWRDRRVDPNLPVSIIPANGSTLGQAMREVAASIQCEVALVENVLLIAPESKANDILTSAIRLHDRLSRETPNTNLSILSWKELSEPDAILGAVASEWQVTIGGSLPHDLWHAKSIETPCTLATQVSLLAGGFDLQITSSNSGLELESLSAAKIWTKQYPRSVLKDSSKMSKLRAEGSIKVRRTTVEATGSSSFHFELLNLDAQDNSVKNQAAIARAIAQPWPQVEIRAPVERVIQAIEARTGMEVRWDQAIHDSLRQQVIELDLKNVTTDEFLQALATQAGLTMKRTGIQLQISP